MQQKYMWDPYKLSIKMVSTGNGTVECAVKKCAGANFKFICTVNF